MSKEDSMFYFHLLKTSIRASIIKRGAFILEMIIMAANNLIFLSLWWIFFQHYQSINGWTMDDMIALMAICLGAYGITQICFGGIKQLSKMIVKGEIDPYLTQPKNVLLHIAGSKSLSKGWGYLLTTQVLLFYCQSNAIAYILLGIVTGSLVIGSMNVIAHSMAFWLGEIQSLSKKYCDSLFLFTLYPTNIYSGLLQLVMFTLIPAGVIGYLPVDLIHNFAWAKVAILFGSSLLFVVLAVRIFYAGLHRYESGNSMGVRY